MAIKLANVSEIQEGKSLIVNGENGIEVALIKMNGKIYAFENVCPHMGGPVGEGDIDGGIISCPWHGWEFNIASCECLTVPGENLKKIPIRIEGDIIYLAE